MAIKVKKTKKAKRMRGKGMGTHGNGARKKAMGSGHRGGFGMAGTGKKADHKKSLVIKKYEKYFGKQGFTSKSTKKRVNNVLNLSSIESNLENLEKKFGKDGVLDLSKFKILGKGSLTKKINIKAKAVSESAKKAIEAAGGKIIVPEVKKVKPKEENEAVEKKAAKESKEKDTA